MNPPRFPRTALAGLVVALLAATAACSRNAPDAPQTAAEAAPITRFDARLNLVNNNGTIRYDGVVDTEANRDAILAMLAQAYGAGSVSGNLAVDRAARPAPWHAALPRFLSVFTQPGAAVAFDGQRIELAGHASEAEREALLARAELLFPGYEYAGLFQGVGRDADTSGGNAVLAAVKPGTSGAALVKALNDAVAQTPVQFEAGSARVAADSLALLSKAAQVIQAAGDGTRIEIAAPGGDDPALAQQRAQAIKVQLIVNGVSPAAIETAASAGSGDAALFRLLH